MIFFPIILCIQRLSCLKNISSSPAAMVFICGNKYKECNEIKKTLKSLQQVIPEGSTLCLSKKSIWPDDKLGNTPHYALFRKGKFLDTETFNLTKSEIFATLKQLRKPHVRVFNGTNIKSQTKKQFALTLSSDSIYEPFYETAFVFRNSPIAFIHKPGNFSITFQDNINNITKIFNTTTPLTQWMKKRVALIPQFPFIPRDYPALIAIVKDGESENVNKLFAYLKHTSPFPVVYGYANWKRDHLRIKNCRILPSSLSFVFLDTDGKCYPFIDDDVISPELLMNFVTKTIQKDQATKTVETSSSYDDDNRIYTLNSTSLLKTIPGNDCKVIHMTNPNSPSESFSYSAFKRVSKYFDHENRRWVTFYQFDYKNNWNPYLVPIADDFPMIALYYPNIEKPLIFRKKHLPGALKQWLNRVAPKEKCVYNNTKEEL